MQRYAKSIGQLLLLFAFIGQWWFLNELKDNDQAIDNAARNYAIARLAGGQYLSMYFQTNDDVLLRKSAAEYANALSLVLLASCHASEELKSRISEIQTDAKKINSLDDYNRFITLVNKREAANREYFERYSLSIQLKRRVSWGFVFGLSVVGIALIGWGESRITESEKRSASKRTK